MKKSIFLFFAAILCAIGMNATTWTVAGDKEIVNGTTAWKQDETENDLTNVSGTKWGLLVENKTLSKKSYYFKITKDHAWTTAYPSSNYNFAIGAAGTYNIIYRFNTSGNSVGADYFKTWTVAGSGAVLTDDWKPDATANDMTRNGNTFEYVLTKKDVKLEKGTTYECKVCKDHAWTKAYPGSNYQFSVATTGYYDVTFKFNVATETVDATTTLINCKVTTSANPTEGGSVTATKEYAKGSSVTLTATPAEGYEFVNWTKEGTVVSTSETYSFTVLEDVSLVANFKVPVPDVVKYQVTVSANDNTMGNVTGGGEYEEGATALLTATPNSGYLFKNWTVAGAEVSTANPYTFTVDADITVTANFQEIPEETVYFINTNKWTGTINAYAWTDGSPKVENAGWPGLAATKEDFQIGGYDVYSYTAKQGLYANVIFNGTGGQTADLTWSEGVDKYNIHNYNGESGWYTQAEAEALLVAPIVYETVYFVNNKNWSLVQIHAWKDAANNGWPGQALTATGEQVAGFDVYSFEAAKGTYTNLLFNNKVGEEGVQSSNYVWTADKYYYMGAAENYTGGTKEEVAVLVTPDPLATEVYLAGDMTNKDNWDVNKKEFRKATADATNASVTVTLEVQTYKFKLVIDGAWKGNTGTMQRGGDAVHEGGWSFDKDGYDDNCQIVADIAGDYTFTWDLNTKKLTVAYPPLPKYTVTATAENGSVTGAGEYEHGSEATLVATPDAGYAFKNWTKGGEEVSTEATYTFTVTANVELVANFVQEVTNEVTVSYLCNGTPIPGQTETKLAVGVTTPSTITAPTIKNYKFENWTLGSGVQSEDATTANPIQITTLGSGEYTLAANYTKIELTYTVEVPAGTEKCYIRGGFDGWDKFHEMELKDGETNIFTLTIDGAVTTHEYKYACQESWDYQEQKEDGGYVENRTWTALDRVEKWAKPVVVTYQLKGVGGWDQPGIELVQNPGNDKEYMLTCQAISATDAIKVVRLEDGVIKDYYGNGTVKDGVTVAVSYDGEANIKLPEGKYNFYFDTNASEKKLWIAAATDCGPATITLTTGDNSAVIAANIDKTVNVKIERSFTANDGYYTLCVPFNMDPSVIGKAYYLGDDIKKHVSGEGIDIELVEETYMLSAGVPYLVLPKANMSELVVENVTIQSDIASGQNVTGGEDLNVQIFFEGFYSAPAAPNNQTNGTTQYYVGEHGYLYNEVVDIRGLSGLFTITDKNGAPLNVRARVVTREEVETGIDNNQLPNTNIQKVLENGQLIIIREGVKYNVQGQKL